jgi:putative FAD dependent oxidoreductase
MFFDKIIIGAGLYGLYAADYCAKRGERVLVLEYDAQPFMRATYINQARVHMGYHYPRSYATAIKSAHYFNRFNEDFGFCVHETFDQIYATSSRFSWTDAVQFQQFCDNAGIFCESVNPERYFQDGMCDGAFLTQEYTYDAIILRDYFLEQLRGHGDRVTMICGARIGRITEEMGGLVLFCLMVSDIRRDIC